MIPVPTAVAARTVPSYHIARNTMGSTNQEMGSENNTMRNGRATTEHHTGGITEEQLFAIMDSYLQERAGNSAQESNAARTDFRQPAPPTPQVITPARGVLNNVGAQGPQRGPGGQGIPSPRVT